MKQLSKQIILLKPPGYNLCDRITKKNGLSSKVLILMLMFAKDQIPNYCF